MRSHVLANYTPVKSYYKLIKKIEDDRGIESLKVMELTVRACNGGET